MVYSFKDDRDLNGRGEQELLQIIVPRYMKRDQELEDNKELLLMLLSIMVACNTIA